MVEKIVEDDIFVSVTLENAVALTDKNIPFPSIIRRTQTRIKLSDTSIREAVQFTMTTNKNGKTIIVDPFDYTIAFNINKNRYLVRETYAPSPKFVQSYLYPTFISASEYKIIQVGTGKFKVMLLSDSSYLTILDNRYLGFGKPGNIDKAFVVGVEFSESLNQSVLEITNIQNTFLNGSEAITETSDGIDYVTNVLGLIPPDISNLPVFDDFSLKNPFSDDQLILQNEKRYVKMGCDIIECID